MFMWLYAIPGLVIHHWGIRLYEWGMYNDSPLAEVLGQILAYLGLVMILIIMPLAGCEFLGM